MKYSGKRTKGTSNGSSLLELVGGMFILVTVTLIAVNIGVLLFAAWHNDSACNAAARAAAQRTNFEDAKQAAQLVLKQFASGGGQLFGSPSLQVGVGNFEFETYQSTDSNSSVDKRPYVRVTTKLQSRLLAPVVFNGVAFTDTINFQQSYVYPILYPAAPGDDTVDDDLLEESDDEGDDDDNDDRDEEAND